MSTKVVRTRPDSAESMQLIQALSDHLDPLYPSESKHGYSVDKLIQDEVPFFLVWIDDRPLGCGGVQLFEEDGGYGELKRMYVRPEARGQGLAQTLLDTLAETARQGGAPKLRLETGIYQEAAIRFYERYGFYEIGPFGPYRLDPNSRFFEMML